AESDRFQVCFISRRAKVHTSAATAGAPDLCQRESLGRFVTMIYQPSRTGNRHHAAVVADPRLVGSAYNLGMHVFLFDIDGTLVSSGGAGRAAMQQALASEFGQVSDAVDVPFSGRTDRAIGRDLFRSNGIEETAANWTRFRDAYLQHLPTCLASHD